MFAHLIEPGQSGVGLAFTNRLGGVSQPPYDSFNLGRTDLDQVVDVASNFVTLRQRLGVSKIITTAQVHGNDVLEVSQDIVDRWGDGAELGDSIAGGRNLVKADAMVTTLADVGLCIRVADCLPVMLADPASRVIGAAHAGRVGLLGGVLTQVVSAMRDLGARQIEAWIGPHICGRCYEVPEPMAKAAWAQLPDTKGQTSWGSPSIDLGRGAQALLSLAGVTAHMLGGCTYEDAALYSHRREHGATGRQTGLIWLR